jgi:HK97 family phage major capsid protein
MAKTDRLGPLLDAAKGLTDKIGAMETRLDSMSKPSTRAQPIGVPTGTPDNPAQAAFIRRGDSALSSRGFMFSKMMLAKACDDESLAKNELALCHRFHDAVMETKQFKPKFMNKRQGFLVPVFPDLIPENLLSNDDYYATKQYITAGIEKADAGQLAWYLGKANVTAPSPVQSWIDQSVGGSFVPPPMFGSPIELLRNKAAMLNAGATVIPLGPSGRIVFPRLTNATQGGWTGENTAQTPSQAGTGTLELQAKKAWGIVVMPGELIRFGSPAVEIMIRNDLFQTVSLIMDKGFLDGAGSSNVPLGLATMGTNTGAGYTAPSSTAYGVSGLGIALPYVASNELTPQNIYDFEAAIKANNATPTVWIMRPEMLAGFFKARTSTYSGGNQTGQFVFDVIRKQGDGTPAMLGGYPVVESVQVSNTRGTGAQTYVLLLNGPDYYIGMFGAIEFTQTDEGWTLLSQDQVAVRALISCDGGSRHPGSVAFADSLGYAVGP